MFIFIFLLYLLDHSDSASDFENARISGTPKLTCTKKSITIYFDTNIPFQGRISIMKKMYIPECNQDYSSNILRNASFKMDISRCTDTTYMTNGSRVLTAHIEIGFHPLVITSSDRVYSVQCVDNSFAIVRQRQPPTKTPNCSHVVRTAAKWEGLTVFHVGDAIVHEWNCALEPQEAGNTQVFLTSCNAISQGGQIIHLVDENGCVVDSELMGELVYNNYIPKIYARAKVFKLMNGERYRVECNIQMCKKDSGTCMNRVYPPKCAFTKDEIVNRYDNRVKHSTDDALMTGGPNTRYDKQVKVTSEWITVHYNQYTNVEQLHERYFINVVMDPNIQEESTTTVPTGHFLIGISYRDPAKKFQTEKERTNDMAAVTNPVMIAPASFKPANNPVISSSEENQIETINEDLASLIPVVPARTSEAITSVAVSPVERIIEKKPDLSLSAKFSKIPPRPPTKPPVFSSTRAITMPPQTRATTQKITPKSTTQSSSKFSGAMASVELKVRKKTTTPSIPTVLLKQKTSKSSLKGSVATMRFYTENEKTTPSTKETTKVFSTTEMPFNGDNKVFTNMVKIATATEPTVIRSSQGKENFANPRDWRLDDRTINDTDIFSSDKQIACTSNSTATPLKRCIWSGLDHLLVVWSFGSALVWVVMLAVCFYRNSKKKPDWVTYREKEMKKMSRARVLPQEHPWLHADAFEEPKLRKKHEIDMSKF